MYDNRCMTQVSKRKLDYKIENELLDSLSYAVKELKTKSEVDKFLSSALTKTERIMIAKRILTAFLLKNNVEDKKISDTLKLTPASITRMKMWSSLNNEGFDVIFNKLSKKGKEDVAKNILYKFINYSLNAASGRVPRKV